MTRMLTVEQAAERLQVTPNTIRTWIKQGRIPGRKIGKVYRIPESALHATLNAGGQAAQGKATEEQSEKERLEALKKAKGMFAGMGRSTDDFMREKYEEVLEEERRWEEKRKSRGSEAA